MDEGKKIKTGNEKRRKLHQKQDKGPENIFFWL